MLSTSAQQCFLLPFRARAAQNPCLRRLARPPVIYKKLLCTVGRSGRARRLGGDEQQEQRAVASTATGHTAVPCCETRLRAAPYLAFLKQK